MKQIKFNRIEIENFLSVGDIPVNIDFKTGLNVITGVNHDKEDSKNGVGKCLDPLTEIDIEITDPTVLEKYEYFNKKIQNNTNPVDK